MNPPIALRPVEVTPAEPAADSSAAGIAASLQQAPAFARCRAEDLARQLPHITEARFAAGQVLFEVNQSADHLYLLLEGSVELASPHGRRTSVQEGCVGLEAGTDRDTYAFAARARTPVRALCLPRRSLVPLVAATPALGAGFYRDLLSLLCGEPTGSRASTRSGSKSHVSFANVAGWALTLVVPAVLMLLGPRMGLGSSATLFLAIFAAAIVMWVFTLVDEYIPGLLAVLSTLMMGLVPTQVILSGFISDSFFEAMSILGLGVVIVASGLSFRLLLRLLRRLPNSPAWHGVGLQVLGFAFTPVVPSNNARVVLVRPILVEMTELLGLKPRGRAATGLAISTFTGINIFTSVFLSAKSVNFIVLGLLSPQGRLEFQWLSWLMAAGVTGAIMLAFHVAASALLFRSDERPKLSREQIDAQLKLLGPLKPAEWAALAGGVVFAIGVVTASVTKVHPPWLALTILYGLLLLKFLDKGQFRERIDWPFLIYLGSMVGIIKAFEALGFSALIATKLAPLGAFMRTQLPVFILILCGIIFVLRLAVPTSATAAIAATVFMPLAEINGINPWVIGFIILVTSEMWLFPYQCSYYLQFREEPRAYNERHFLAYNALMNVTKLVALYASLPYWKALGLV